MDVIDTISNFLDGVDQSDNPRFRYPLSHQTEYKGTVKFTALKADYQTIGSTITGTNNNVSTSINNPFDQLLKELNEFFDVLSDLKSLLGGTFKTFEYNGVSHDPVGSVTMHLPSSLTFRDGIDYQNIAFGAVGSAAEQGLKSSSGDVYEAVKAGASNAFSSIESVIDAFRGTVESETAGLYAQRAISKFSEPIGGALEVTQGITLNPNRRSLLRGVATRNFGFTFKLIPHNKQEANEIKNIIRFFRKNMYPEDLLDETTTFSVGYRYPNKFLIELAYDGDPVASKILPCFLQGFDTNYNPNSMSFHKDGEFPEIDISLTFIEERALRRQDITKGY